MTASEVRPEWFAKYVDRLREAAQTTDDDDYREWFTDTADSLEAGRRVMCLAEIMSAADRVLISEGDAR